MDMAYVPAICTECIYVIWDRSFRLLLVSWFNDTHYDATTLKLGDCCVTGVIWAVSFESSVI